MDEPFAVLTELERALGSTLVPVAKLGSGITLDTDVFAGRGLGMGCAVCAQESPPARPWNSLAGAGALERLLLSQPLRGTYFM